MSKQKEEPQGDGFGWSDKVDVPESSFELLPEGEAMFEIVKLERQRKEFGKYGVCNVAVLSCMCASVDTDAKGEIQVQLPLVKQMGWKILQVATACGFRKNGDGSQVDPRWWAKFEGAGGRCTIGHRKYTGKKDGKEKTANEITEWLSADGAEQDGLNF
jgi:hypothetical protein